ncbi:hypothetical protein [Actinophytocola sediminis]
MPDPMRRLNILVGRWEVILDHHALGHDVRGATTFEWLDGVYLEQRLVVDHPGFMNGMLIIGGDDQTGLFSVCYADDRGTRRIYQMSVEDDVWRLWREGTDFAHRFTGTFNAVRDVIDGVWERSTDGETWDFDFRLTYRRLS